MMGQKPLASGATVPGVLNSISPRAGDGEYVLSHGAGQRRRVRRHVSHVGKRHGDRAKPSYPTASYVANNLGMSRAEHM